MAKRTDNAEMPFLDHLEELRWRIIWSLLALIIGIGVSWWILASTDIFAILERPIEPYLNGKKLIFTHPTDMFRTLFAGALAMGTVLALPVIGFQVWAFLSPALYRHEKKVVIPVLFFGTILFLGGMALSYYLILPLTLRMLLSIQSQYVEPMITLGDYFDFAITMSLAMGLVFELPILVVALTALGVVSPPFLTRFRRYAVVLSLVGSAFITPGQDPFSLLALALPLYGLYELSIWASWIIWRRQQKRAARLANDGLGAPA